MTKGELRSEIMDNCPEEFEEELKDFIDKLEGLVGEIVSELDISSVGDLDKIESAYNLADDLSDALY